MTEPIFLTDEERRELVATRRDLHRHPELAFEERRTAGVVAERLAALGYESRTGVAETGVVTTLRGRSDGPCVLLRADMDALPLRELSRHDYRSTIDNRMHACGHDGHTAIALSVARLLRRLPPPERGTIKLVFQPAEETGGGAKRMIAESVLDDPRVDAAFGLHLWSGLPTGQVSITEGPVMASVDEFRVRVIGQGGHGAEPQKTRDPVLAAAHIITTLQQIVSRNVDPLQSAVVTVGSVHAGDAFNIIPDEAVLSGTMRSFAPDVWAMLPDAFERVVRASAAGSGCDVEITIDRVNRPTVNDPAMTALVREVAAGIVGAGNITTSRTMGGEDFCEFLARVPGCFFFVGSAGSGEATAHPHHSPYFDIDEEALEIGVRLLIGVAHAYLAR